jgi:ArsR family transcriptional regulator
MKTTDKELYKHKAEILKSLSHPLRLAIIDILNKAEKSVEEITTILQEKQSNVSKHLFILKKSGIVDNKKVGLKRFYYLKYSCIIKFSLCVEETIKQKFKDEKNLIKHLI